MKKLFIEARYNEKFYLPKKELSKLPERLCLATTVQFLDSIDGIKNQLEKSGRKVSYFHGKKTKYRGQVLGCEILKGNSQNDDFLYIGDGKFHPIALKLKSEKEVYIYNPFKKKVEKLETNEIEKIKKKYLGALAKFYASEKIGILVSTKSGQSQMKKALEFKKNLGDKECFVFLCDTLDFQSLENFTFIQVWVNTMCPRIAFDDAVKIRKPIINIEDV